MSPAWLGLALAGTSGMALWQALQYVRDMRMAYARIIGTSDLLSSPLGDIEYAQGGEGPAVLVIHGSGGGFDQGELIARAALSSDMRWIAPSRFGYLRSTFRPGATFDDQAHAYAHLLDHLKLDRVAVVTLSHGGPSALLFALLHPQRVSSLTLLSAGVAASAVQDQQAANSKGNALTTIYQHDWLYWSITHAFRSRFLNLMGASNDVIASLSATQRRLLDEVVDCMNPVVPRAKGVVFDNRAQLPNERIRGIRTPTLVVHARDDSLQLFHNAEFASQNIPGAKLAAFDKGGHVLIAVEQPTIQALVREHIRKNLAPPVTLP